MKNVLLTVHKFFPHHGAGTEVLALKTAQELQKRGYQVTILTANPPHLGTKKKAPSTSSNQDMFQYEYAGLKIYCLSEEARLNKNRFSHEHYNPHLKKYFQFLLEELTPDIVHCFHLQNLSASLIEEASSKHIPVVYSATDFWLICPVVQLRRPDGSNCCGPAPLAVNCLTCYTPQLFPEQAEFAEAFEHKYPEITKTIFHLPTPLNKIAADSLYFAYEAKKLPSAVMATAERPDILKRFSKQLAAITVPTKLMQELFVRNGLNAKQIHHVAYGIDTEPLKQGQKKTPSDELRIAFIGTLAAHKGPDLLIEAFLQLPPTAKAALQIYGDPDQFPSYSQYLHALANSESPLSKKINFAGTFGNERIGEVFKHIDVLVVPSRWYENTPLVIQSALAAKTPVIATNLGGMSELIKHEFNGLLFEPDNTVSLTNELLKLIESKALLEQLVTNIKPERTVAEMVDQLEAIYLTISPLNDRQPVDIQGLPCQ